MSTLHLSDTLLDGYVALFDQLESKDQTILLDRLVQSTKKTPQTPVKGGTDIPDVIFLSEPENTMSLEELAGSWKDDRSTEKIIEDLRRSRTPNLERVNL